MAIPVTCPNCRKMFSVDDKYAGKRGKCGKCGSPINVSALSTIELKPTPAPITAPVDGVIARCIRCSHQYAVLDLSSRDAKSCPRCAGPVVIPKANTAASVPAAPPKDESLTAQCISCSHRFTLSEKPAGAIACKKCGGPATLIKKVAPPSPTISHVPESKPERTPSRAVKTVSNAIAPLEPEGLLEVATTKTGAMESEPIWYIKRNNREHGPHSFAVLKSAVSNGFLDSTDLVKRQGSENWFPAECVAGLFATGNESESSDFDYEELNETHFRGIQDEVRWTNPSTMKPPLVDFTRKPGLGTGFPNLVRGTLSLGATIVLGFAIVYGAAEAYQLDRDGEIGIGQVASTTERTTRRRRGRISIRYELDVSSSHGMLSLSSSSRIAPGEHVRYIYSPSSKIAQPAPEPLQRGDMLWDNCCSFTTICGAIGILCCAYYSYDQYWWIYVVASGRYTVNGKRLDQTDVQRTNR